MNRTLEDVNTTIAALRPLIDNLVLSGVDPLCIASALVISGAEGYFSLSGNTEAGPEELRKLVERLIKNRRTK